MVLVLCDVTDTAALWAIGGLQERGVPVDLVTAPALGSAARWEHRLSAAGASVEITLSDGRRLSSAEPVGILNRLTFVPTDRLDRTFGADRDYAVQELNALFLSWLHAMPGPLINRPTPQGLSGNWRHPSVWAALAARAGLPAAAWRQSHEQDGSWAALMQVAVATVFVVGEEVIAPPQLPADAEQAAACLRLARAAGDALLGIDFAPSADGRWEVIGASPRPDLVRGGPALADALARALTA